MAKIGDIVTEVKYGTSKPAVDGGKYPYLRMNNLTYDGHLDLTDLKRIDILDNEIEKCIVRKGDVLFNRTNSIELVGKTCVFDEDEDMVIAGYIIRVRLKPVLLPIVLSNFMNTDALKKKLRNMAKGAVNQANINAQELQAINIYLPPIALQKQFATFVEVTDKSKFCGKSSAEKGENAEKSTDVEKMDNKRKENTMNEEKEYNEFMAKMVQKSLEINDDFKKLSPDNQTRVNQEMQAFLNALFVTKDIMLINRFRSQFMKQGK